MIITNSPNKGIKCQVSDFSLVVDPEKNASANLILRTETAVPIEEGKYSEIIGAGEYETDGTRIIGINLDKESDSKKIRTAYVITFDEINLCFLGNSITSELSEETLEKIGEPDILFIPEATKNFDAKKLAHLIKQIEPHVMIPINEKVGAEISKELGQKSEKMEKFVIKKKELLEMNSKLILIESGK